jgi:hypothetical protein
MPCKESGKKNAKGRRSAEERKLGSMEVLKRKRFFVVFLLLRFCASALLRFYRLTTIRFKFYSYFHEKTLGWKV